MTIIETMKAFLSGVSGYLLQFYAKEDGADKPNKVMSVASDGLILHNSDEEDIPFKGQNIYEIDPSYTDITEDQELFIDGSPSVVTSDGREPVTGYAGGTYIPATVNIEGVEYPNPSLYDGTADSPVAKARGTYGFFESWTNVAWRETSDWSSGGSGVITKVGDWLSLEAIAANDTAINTGTGSATNNKICSFLVKKGIGDVVNLGNSTTTPSNNISYTFSTGAYTDGTTATAINVVKLSDKLAFIQYELGSVTNVTIQGVNAGDIVYFKDVQAVNDISFIPPYGQDGNASSDNRAYNCDKWDRPISFTFKPQFDYDTSDSCNVFTDSPESVAVSDENCYFRYGQSADQFIFKVRRSGVDTLFYLSKASGSWEVAKGTPVTAYTSNTLLHEEIEVVTYLDHANDKVVFSLDGELFEFNESMAGFEPNNIINIGSHVWVPRLHSNGYITNFCSLSVDQSFPLALGIQFTDPNKQYGRNAKWFLDQFGNTPYGSTLSSTGGIVEEGNNVNGSWVRFENGLLVQFGYFATSGTALLVPLPVEYQSADKYIPIGTVQAGSASTRSIATLRGDNASFNAYLSPANDLYWLTVGY